MGKYEKVRPSVKRNRKQQQRAEQEENE